jgi:urease accessory protein UreF
MWVMAKRTRAKKAKELTIRVSAEERRAIEGAAVAYHLPASTSARQTVLRRVEEARLERERREERRRSGRALAALLRSLPDDRAHADELERSRREDWKR